MARNLISALQILIFVALSISCAAPEREKPAAIPPAPKLTEAEREIRSMKTADFDYIYVFKRKDGGKMTSEDKRFIKEKSHFATNRFTLSKDESTVFAGSNFAFDKKNLEDLKKRFDFEDHSKPADQIKREEEAKQKKSSGNEQGIVNSNSNT